MEKTSEKEALILRIGIALAVLLGAFIVYWIVVDLKLAQTLVMALGLHTIGGRAAGIGVCIHKNMTDLETIGYNFYLEVLIVCFTYAVFIMSVKNRIKLRFLKYHLIKLERKARKQKVKIQKYGWFGVFLFVMVPLPVTGPVVGSVIGYMLKFSLRKNFSAVFAGTFGAIVLWTIFFDVMKKYQFIWYIIGGIIILVLLSYIKKIIEWFSTKKTNNKPRRDDVQNLKAPTK